MYGRFNTCALINVARIYVVLDKQTVTLMFVLVKDKVVLECNTTLHVYKNVNNEGYKDF